MTNSSNLVRRMLRAGTALSAMSIVMTAAPSFAQTTQPGAQVDPNAVPTTTDEAADEQGATQNPAPGEPVAGTQTDTEGDDAIVVTGTILRATSKATPSPVQVIDFDESDKRGINTVNDAIQTISANGAGALPNAFTAGGAFAAGASAASLRGLLTSNTLTLFDGMRAAYYPLADDGTRNFVDLNTVPDAIVDRVEVLKDGASSTYGADAVAGVVNIITRRQINGLNIDFSGGVSKYGDGKELNAAVTYGYGDLDTDGFNAYVNASYYQLGDLKQRDRGFPYNTGEICSLEGAPEPGFAFNNPCIINIAGSPALYVRPSGPNNTTGFLFGPDPDGAGPLPAPVLNPFQLLNPAAGCNGYPNYVLTPAQQAPGIPNELCQEDFVQNYFSINFPLERISASARVTANLSDSAEAYAMVNYVQTDTWGDSVNATLRVNRTPPALGPFVSTTTLALPVWICPDGVDCANDPQRQLNPQNPFAAAGSQARISGRLGSDVIQHNDLETRALRGSAGASGQFLDDWRWKVDATAMKVTNDWTRNGFFYVANLLNAINTGELNLLDFSQNSQATIDNIWPTVENRSTSKLAQFQGSIAKDLMELPGGPLQVGVGASIRREEVNAPSANPDRDANGNPVLDFADVADIDPNQRFVTINPFGTSGKRTVKSVYAELLAPVVDQLDINLSARYDTYTGGANALSPKVGVKFTPIREIALRGTWSKGFRIASFAESTGTPSTGYVTGTNTVPAAYTAVITGVGGGVYLTNYALGITGVSNPDLKPEKSRNFTIGVVAEPVRNVSFSVDFWDIKKDDVITGADYTDALANYYATGQTTTGIVTIVPDTIVPLPAGVPANTPARAAFVIAPFINAATQRAKGIDFAADAKFNLGNGIRFNTNLEASRMLRLANCFDAGCQEFVGTIGPYIAVSAAGTPKWRGSWQNTLEYGRAYASLTAFYTSGYKTTAEDIFGSDTADDCSHNLSGNGDCTVGKTLYWNLGTGLNVTDDARVYLNINNLFDKKPPLDTATYGGYLYNPAWAHPMMIGRFFRVGAKVKM